MLQGELEDLLALQGKAVLVGKTAYIRIPLTEQFQITLRPVDVGFDGYSEWMSWHEHKRDDKQQHKVHYSIRASVELTCKRKASAFSPLTFTVHQRNLKNLIRCSLEIIEYHTGKRLAPKFIKIADN